MQRNFSTDGDNIGNEKDTDDDNDGVSDEEEIENGTDPLVPNETTEESGESSREEPEDIEQIEPVEKKGSDNSETGLERFLSDGAADDMFSAVTEKIENTKQSLDTYRERRNESIEAEREAREEATYETNVSDSGNTATITRTRLEPKVSLFERFVALAKNLISGVWSVILLVVSFILGFPALIELVLLWLILVILYRTARKYGRRPRP